MYVRRIYPKKMINLPFVLISGNHVSKCANNPALDYFCMHTQILSRDVDFFCVYEQKFLKVILDNKVFQRWIICAYTQTPGIDVGFCIHAQKFIITIWIMPYR